MNDNGVRNDSDLRLAAQRRIDRQCLAFEDAWKSGNPQTIEGFLRQVAEGEQAALLRELLLIDTAYRRQRGGRPKAEEYEVRFPAHRAVIAEALGEDRRHLDAKPDDGPSLEVFCRRLADSGLMTAEEVRQFIADLPAERRPTTARRLAREMHGQGLITRFQARAVYEGKTRGLVVGNYVVLDKLGHGGMGQVYTARHRKMKRLVAIKMLPSSSTKSSDAVKRFQREVQAAAKLSHPNIVTAHDADEANGIPFLVMEYVDGQDLTALVKQHGPLSVAQAVDCVVQAAKGLEYAHRQGVIHRDIKPANLLLDKSGVVKILDMGLARLENAVGGGDDGLTNSGHMMGTLDYMAPEQALDTHNADARSDVYGLGCTLHYLLTGRAPFHGDTVTKKILAHREEPAPLLRARRKDVPEWLDRAFQRMLAKNPADRPQTMGEVMIQLQQEVLPQTPPAAPIPAPSVRPGDADETLSLHNVEVDTSSENVEFGVPAEELVRPQPVAQPRRWKSWASDLLARLSRRQRIAIAAAVGMLFAFVLFSIILSLRTKDGTLVVEIDDPDVTVQVLSEQGKVQIERKGEKGTIEISVDPGKHRLRLQKNGVEVFAQDFTLASGGKEIIRAKLAAESKSLATAEPRPKDLGYGPDAPPTAVAPFHEKKAKEEEGTEKAGPAKQIRVFRGHGMSVNSVAFSPDGKRVLTGSDDNTAILWNTDSGTQIRAFEGHGSCVESLAFSRDGKRVLTGSSDNTAVLWDADSGKKIRDFTGHSDGVYSVAFNADGSRVLTGSWDHTAILWNTDSGKKIRDFNGHGDWVNSVAISPDGSRVLTGSSDWNAVLWNADTGEQIRAFKGHRIHSVTFSSDGKQVLAGSWDNTAILWNADTGEQIRAFKGHNNHVTSVAFSPDDKRVLTGSDDHTAILWDANTGKQVLAYKGHTAAVLSVAFSPDGKRVLTGSSDNTAILWDAVGSTSGGKSAEEAPGTVSKANPESLKCVQGPPPILAHDDSPLPAIHGPRIMGTTPGRPFLFLIPATGESPMTYSAKNFPEGLQLDAKTGIISGSLRREGEFVVELQASNARGTNKRNLTIVGGQHKLALTPPMGWNSCYALGADVSDEKIHLAADALIRSGLAAHGYQFVNIDSGWEGGRGQNGEIVPNSKFPNMHALADYVHGKGLKLGLFSSSGPIDGFEGNYQHEQEDLKTWTRWGIDYLKYLDLVKYGPNNDRAAHEKFYLPMRKALDNCDRDVVFAIAQPFNGNAWEWGEEVGGNLWRTTDNINDSYASLNDLCFNQFRLAPYAKPGHWNDPDMLMVGKLGGYFNFQPRSTNLKPHEQVAHFTLWSMMAAPLIISCDLAAMDEFTLALLTNPEVIDVDQDPLGKAATRIKEDGSKEVWARPLFDGTQAVSLFNRGPEAATIRVDWKDLNLQGDQLVRDLWQRKDLGQHDGGFQTVVQPHGAVLLKIGRAEEEKATEEVKSGEKIRVFRHKDQVTSVAFSPDGKRVLTGSDTFYGGDGPAILWDADSGEQIRAVKAHMDGVTCVKFSPDGKQVLAASRNWGEDGAILWDASTGEQIRLFKEGHQYVVMSVAFSPDGRRVLTGAWDHTAILWDASNGEKIRAFNGHKNSVISVAFSPDGRRVLTGSWDHTAILWDAATGEQIRAFSGRGDGRWPYCVAFSPDGKRVLTGSGDGSGGGMTILWDADSGKQIRVFKGHKGTVNSVAFSPDGRRVLTGSDDHMAILWDASTGKQVVALKGHTDAVISVAFSPDGKRALTGSWDHTAILWDADSDKQIRNSE